MKICFVYPMDYVQQLAMNTVIKAVSERGVEICKFGDDGHENSDILYIRSIGYEKDMLMKSWKIFNAMNSVSLPCFWKDYKERNETKYAPIYKRADCIGFHGDYTRRMAYDFLWEREGPNIKHIVDDKLFKPMDVEKNGKNLVMVSNFDNADDHLYNVLESMPYIVKSIDDVKLHVFGWYSKLELYLDKVKELKIDGNVNFVGCIRHEDLPIIYNSADAFLLPQFGTTYPKAPMEAMSCGTPVVGSGDWFEEEVGDGGIYVDFGYHGYDYIPKVDPNKFAEGVLKCLDDKVKLGLNARKKVEQEYSMDVMGKKFVDIFTGMLHG